MRLPRSVFGRLEAAVDRLGSARARGLVVAVATLFAATSVGPHRALDDFVLALIARGQGGPLGLHRGTLDLFTFTTGDPANNRELIETGLMLPWWTDPELKISFFRPLSSLTHVLDERLFPSSAVLMHLHSLGWFAFLLLAVAAVYKRLEPTPVLAGFSLALYAFDDAHGTALAWLANRNALIATGFACLALAAHDAARRGGKRAAVGLGPAALLVGLLAGEAGIGVLGYLAAYAIHRDRGTLRDRVLSLVPYGVVVVVWRFFWSRYGFGARGSGAYIDPLGDPAAFLAVLPEKLLMLFQGQFAGPPSDLAFIGPPAHRPALVVLAVVTFVAVITVLVPVVRKDETSRFWATGAALSFLPLAATFPSDRLLLFVGLGAMPLLARLFHGFFATIASGADPGPGPVFVTLALLGVHTVAAPLLLPARSSQMEIFGRVHDRAARGVPGDARTVVVVAVPSLILANYVQAERAVAGAPRPEHLYVLSTASSALTVSRTGANALTVRPEHGFLYTPLERHYRGTKPLEDGTTVTLAGMRAEVKGSGDGGRPAAVEFSFGALADTVFLTWQDGRFVPFLLPEVGGKVELPEQDLNRIVMQAALAGDGA